MKKFAVVRVGDYESVLKSFLSSREEVEKLRELLLDYSCDCGIEAKEIETDNILFLQVTTHKSSGNYSETEQVVTLDEFAAKKKKLENELQDDLDGYREGRLNGYALAHVSCSEYKIECRDHRSGVTTIELVSKIKIHGEKFQLQRLSEGADKL